MDLLKSIIWRVWRKFKLYCVNMIIIRETTDKGMFPETFKKQHPYEIAFGGDTKYFTDKGLKELQSELNEFLK